MLRGVRVAVWVLFCLSLSLSPSARAASSAEGGQSMPLASPGAALDQNFLGPITNGGQYTGSAGWLAQTFTASIGGSLTDVVLDVINTQWMGVNNGSGPFTVEVTAVTGVGYPDLAAVLARGNFTTSPVEGLSATGDRDALVNVAFATPVKVQAGHQYAIVLVAPNASCWLITQQSTITGPCPGGSPAPGDLFTLTGLGWVDDPHDGYKSGGAFNGYVVNGWDYYFQTYVIPDGVAPAASHVGHIVQWAGDPNAQKTAWLVGPDLHRRWIPDVSTYSCLKSAGHPVDAALPSYVLDQLSDLTNVWAVCGASRMGVNSILMHGDYARSPNGQYRLILQHDGNLVLYNQRSEAVWATYGFGADFLLMQSDGNLVAYKTHGGAVWSSGTDGRPATALIVRNDGHVALTDDAGKVIWIAPAPTPTAGGTRYTAGDAGYGIKYGDIPCEHPPYLSTGKCAGYDWGPVHDGSQKSTYSVRLFGFRNCTDFVAFKLGFTYGHPFTGDASNWQAGGAWKETASPAPGDIAQWVRKNHVGIVIATHPANRTVDIEDYNGGQNTGYGTYGVQKNVQADHYFHKG